MFLSIIFAQIIGIYLVLVSIGTLLHQQRYRKVSQEFLGTQSLIAITENLSLLLGLIILVFHHVWVLYWPILITIIGWILVIRGIIAIFLPALFMRYSKYLLDRKGFIFMAWLCLVVGIILTWIGFTQ